jgi:hypothetical protein
MIENSFFVSATNYLYCVIILNSKNMQLIVYHDVPAAVSPRGFNACVKISYLLAEVTYLVGIEYPMFRLDEVFKRFTLKQKIDYLKRNSTQGEDEINYFELEMDIKNYNKSKYKSSKSIVAFKILMRTVESAFDAMAEEYIEKMDMTLGLKTISELIDFQRIGFFAIPESNPEPEKLVTLENILSMNFPASYAEEEEEEIDNPLFIINMEQREGFEKIDFDLIPCDAVAAENVENVYGENGFVFPRMGSLTANEMKTIDSQMTESLVEIRGKIEEWAKICYEKPNSIDGLLYFRATLNPMLKKSEQQMFDNPILKNTSDSIFNSSESQLIFAQMPIYQIWNWFKKTSNITPELFNQLLDLKQKESPKYEGRWPVLLLVPIAPHESKNIIAEEDIVKSVRKTIKLD